MIAHLRDKMEIPLNIATLSAIVVIGGCLRVAHLGQKSYSWLELCTVRICGLPFSSFCALLWQFEANMSFYYLLVRLWIKFGDGEAWLRLLSVIFAIASIPVIYAIGKRVSGNSTGLAAALILSVNAAHVAYAQEARSYALLMLLCLLSLLFFLRMAEFGASNAFAYALVSALAVYAQFFAVFFLFAQWTSTYWLRRDVLSWKKFLSPILLTAIFIAPALSYMIFRHSGQLTWVRPTQLKDLSGSIYFLAADSGRFHKALAILYLLCFATAVRHVFLRWQLKPSSVQNWGTIVVIHCAVLPIVVTFSLSFWKPMFEMRYLLMCLPPLVVLVAQGLMEVRPAWLRLGVYALIVGLSAGSLSWYYAQPNDGWRPLTAYLVQHAQARDVIVICPPIADWPIQYYSAKTASPNGQRLTYVSPDTLLKDVQSHQLSGKPLSNVSFWMVDWGDSPDADNIQREILNEYTRLDQQQFPRSLTLTHYANSGE
jgi:mannosyltransferase